MSGARYSSEHVKPSVSQSEIKEATSVLHTFYSVIPFSHNFLLNQIDSFFKLLCILCNFKSSKVSQNKL